MRDFKPMGPWESRCRIHGLKEEISKVADDPTRRGELAELLEETAYRARNIAEFRAAPRDDYDLAAAVHVIRAIAKTGGRVGILDAIAGSSGGYSGEGHAVAVGMALGFLKANPHLAEQDPG